MMMVLRSSRVFQVVSIEDFFSGAPNMANDMSISIISVISGFQRMIDKVKDG
jgi:hypothetical protein